MKLKEAIEAFGDLFHSIMIFQQAVNGNGLSLSVTHEGMEKACNGDIAYWMTPIGQILARAMHNPSKVEKERLVWEFQHEVRDLIERLRPMIANQNNLDWQAFVTAYEQNPLITSDCDRVKGPLFRPEAQL